MYKIFLSYSREDREVATRIYQHLVGRYGSNSVFFSRLLETFPPFDSPIERALQESKVYIVLIGPRRSTSEFLEYEITSAIRKRKRVMPVLIDGAEIPGQLECLNALPITSALDPDVLNRLTKDLSHHLTPPAMAVPHQIAALRLHILIVCIFGVLALTSIAGGIYAIVVNATSPTVFRIFGAELSTGHVGVALVGIGFIITFFTVRSVLKNQRDLAALPSDDH